MKVSRTENIILGIVLVAGLSYSIGPIIAMNIREHNLEQNGVITEAIIEHYEDTGKRHNTNPIISVYVRFILSDGRVQRSNTDTIIQPFQVHNLQNNSTTTIKYNAKNPEEIMLIF